MTEKRRFTMKITAGGDLVDEGEELVDEEPEAPRPARNQYDSRLMWWLTALSVVWVATTMAAAIQMQLFDAPGMARLAFVEGLVLGVITTRYHELNLWPRT